jgi:hypothetical protein
MKNRMVASKWLMTWTDKCHGLSNPVHLPKGCHAGRPPRFAHPTPFLHLFCGTPTPPFTAVGALVRCQVLTTQIQTLHELF